MRHRWPRQFSRSGEPLRHKQPATERCRSLLMEILEGRRAPAVLVAGYAFDEGGGTTVNDASGTGNQGTAANTTSSTAGKFGSALSFNGTNAVVTIPDAASLDLTTGMTLEAWVRPSAVSSAWRDVIYKGNDMYYLEATSGNASRPAGGAIVGSSNLEAFGTTALAINTWTHLAATYDGANLRLFVNGAQISTSARTGTIQASNNPLQIGGDSIFGQYFAGLIDEVRVYNGALTAAQIQADMNTPIGLVTPDTQPPTAPANLTATAVSASQINLSWTASTDNVGVTGYRVERQDPLSSNFVQVGAPTGTTFNNSGLSSGATYNYRVRAADAAVNLGPYSPVASATTSGPDAQPPTVSIVTPIAGSTVTHVVVISATAADNVGVASVQFFVDGNSLGTDFAAPYSANWNSTTASNGLHNLTAVARDAPGNVATSASVSVTALNPGFVNEVVVPGITAATTIAFLPDGRMLVGELTNVVWIVQPGANSPDPLPFLQLSYNFLFGEQGLMDIFLDPNFAQTGYYYVFYTQGFTGQNNRDRLSRFTASGNGTVPGSEVVLWQDDVNANAEHHGGAIAFGNDGKLYFTTGEHFNPPLAQQLNSYRGKVLRINSDGSIPTDNPFYDGAGPNKDAIWAYGLRNPYRMSIDAVSGRMYIGDVGGNDASTAFEEVNLGVAGANYGWPLEEGPGGTPGVTPPIHSYPHSGQDAAVTGGFVYRGSQFPSEYYGSYFFGDFAQNTIKRLTLDAGGNVTGAVNFWPADGASDGPLVGDPVKFVQGPDGSLYYVDIGFDGYHVPNQAGIRRIRFTINNLPPLAAASANPLSGQPPLSVAFSSAGSFDPEGATLNYSWTFGDGGTSNEANPTHLYQTAGSYVARLSVSDGTNSTLSDSLTITVGNPPVPTILSPANGIFFRAGDVINYSGSASDEDVPLPASAFSWTILFHHDTHVHPAGGPFTGSTSGLLVIPQSGHDFLGSTSYEIILTVTDSTGLPASTSVTVYPEKVDLTFDTVPSGLTISIDGINKQTPFVQDDIINFQHTIAAPNQSGGGASYTFVNWSDGGAQSHGIVVPASNQSYLATFQVTQSAGLVGAYSFNAGGGTAVADASGTGNNGTTANTTWSTAGRYGNALSFNGTSARVTIPDAASLDLTTGMTLEAWVRPSAVTNKWRDVIYKGNDVYYLEATSSNGRKPAGGGIIGSSNLEAFGTTALAVNTWTHLAATYDGSNLRLFVNGAQVSSKVRAGSLQTSNNPLQIGGDSIFGQYFAGLIDEVRIYNRALSASAIQADMNTPIGAAAQLAGREIAGAGGVPWKDSAKDRADLATPLAIDDDYSPEAYALQAMAGAIAVDARQLSSASAASAPSALSRPAMVAFSDGSSAAPPRLAPQRNLDALWAELDLLEDLLPGKLKRVS
ncbi:MAG: LamG-like jellyroll fold domain-containing protein [Pirellulales bacterium]